MCGVFRLDDTQRNGIGHRWCRSFGNRRRGKFSNIAAARLSSSHIAKIPLQYHVLRQMDFPVLRHLFFRQQL